MHIHILCQVIFKREKVIILSKKEIHMFSSHLFYQMILWYIFDIDGFV